MAHVSKFTLGWICALELECAVACELLDHEYLERPAGIPKNDPRSYSFGRIGTHNVVIACLPGGKYGLTSATGVAVHMHRSFPSIESYLMVGIAGGAPSEENDVRLGDIVVSLATSQGTHSGVIHYKYGKTIQGQPFRRTGAISGPPPGLLSAVQLLRVSHRRNGHRISETVDAICSRNPRLAPDYSKPNSSADILFHSTFLHGEGKQSCHERCISSQEEIVTRSHRHGRCDKPVIHYGLIASSDELLKDATIRDALVQNEGALCVEMEAAGLMDQVPCIVIRGICDYADTHKNDSWQGYAAACAAAYAKELATVIPGGKVSLITTPKKSQSSSQDVIYQDQANVLGPDLPATIPSDRCTLFSELDDSRLYIAPTCGLIWERMTLSSILLYNEIYDAISPKDEKGYVSLAAVQRQIPDEYLRHKVSEYWGLFNNYGVERKFPKGYVMALLFMLHTHKCLGYRWQPLDRTELFTLRRFDKWIPCLCEVWCGLEWNYTNDMGMCRRVPEHRGQLNCVALRYVRSTKSERSSSGHVQHGKAIDRANWKNWKEGDLDLKN